MKHRTDRRKVLAWIAAASPATWAPGALAQADDYPSRPIRLVVPYGAGGGTDQMARLVAEKLRQRLGQTVLVDNKPGGGTVIGSDFVAKQPADGYTLLLTTSGLTSSPAMVAKLPFDPVKDFTPIALLGVLLISLSATNSLPAGTVRDLIAYMKANPGKLNYGSYGIATTNNVAMALFNQRAGVSSTHVPYKSGAQLLPDLMTGNVHLVLDSMQTSGPLYKAGKIKILALASSRPSALLPGMPIVADTVPKFEFEPWTGILGPAGMPRSVVARLNREISAILKEPDMEEAMKAQYVTPTPGTPEQMQDIVRKDVAYWAAAAQVAGVKPE